MEENEWEAISGTTTTTHSDEDDGDVVVVATPTGFHHPSTFPPSNHEGLPVTPPPSPPPQDHHFNESIPATSSPPPSYTSSLTSSSSGEDETELPCQPEAGSTGIKARLGILSSGVLRIAYRIRSRIGIWSIASMAAILTVALLTVYGRRWQRWRKRIQRENRDQMLLLINQKDEKIKQLLIQIDQMNEILSTRTRVPVHRIVVDRPLIIKQRLN